MSWETRITVDPWTKEACRKTKKGPTKQNSHKSTQARVCFACRPCVCKICSWRGSDKPVTPRDTWFKDVRKRNRLWRKLRERERRGDWNVKQELSRFWKTWEQAQLRVTARLVRDHHNQASHMNCLVFPMPVSYVYSTLESPKCAGISRFFKKVSNN